MVNGWIGIGLDGTLAKYTIGQSFDTIGEPIPEMINFVKTKLRLGIQIKIFTSRVCLKQTEQEIAYQVQLIREWCQEHLGQVFPITAQIDFYMLECYDTHFYNIEFNTGKRTTYLV